MMRGYDQIVPVGDGVDSGGFLFVATNATVIPVDLH